MNISDAMFIGFLSGFITAGWILPGRWEVDEKEMKFIIKGELPDLNTYIDECRRNKYSANKMKHDAQEAVLWAIRAQIKQTAKITRPVQIRFLWACKDKRKDIDNVAFAKKFILDALVNAKVLPNDNREWVKGFIDEFIIDRRNPRTEVTITEVGNA